MPYLTSRPCRAPGCPALVSEIGVYYCPRHKRLGRGSEEGRLSPSQRGYNSRWVEARARYLAANPLCVIHREMGRYVPATEVDHIEPHRGDRHKFWDTSNWQPLCHACHSRKTATEDGGFGNRKQ